MENLLRVDRIVNRNIDIVLEIAFKQRNGWRQKLIYLQQVFVVSDNTRIAGISVSKIFFGRYYIHKSLTVHFFVPVPEIVFERVSISHADKSWRV